MAYPGLPLDKHGSFRIMHLQPGQPGEEIYFRLETVVAATKQPKPDYEALSYTWGDANLQRDIFCSDDATRTPTPLKVTVNCHDALQCLRYADQPRSLWIDAVCIDQANIKERNAQVKIMGSIFADAREVVVYLGESADDSDLVMEWYKNEYEVPEYPRKDITVSKPSYEARNAFARRPWFSRTWVLQEAAHARSVVIKCGALTLPWEAYDLGSGYEAPVIKQLIREVRTLADKPSESVIFDVLKATRRCISSDPRDKIYGILPLIPQHLIPSFLTPDYNISSQELFTRVAGYLYPSLGPSLLGHVSENQLDLLPSWVPDWTSMQNSPKKLSTRDAGGNPLSSCQAQRHGIVCDRKLHIEGVHIGSLSKVARIHANGKNESALTEWCSMAEALCDNILESEGSEVVLDTTIGFSDVVTQGHHSGHGYIKFLISQDELMWPIESANRLDSEIQWFYDITRGCFGRRFAIVGPYTAALVPAAAQLDDVVYVLAGAPVPYLLRKKGDVYVLIRECYVHGIMDGEAVDGVDPFTMEKLVIVQVARLRLARREHWCRLTTATLYLLRHSKTFKCGVS